MSYEKTLMTSDRTFAKSYWYTGDMKPKQLKMLFFIYVLCLQSFLNEYYLSRFSRRSVVVGRIMKAGICCKANEPNT